MIVDALKTQYQVFTLATKEDHIKIKFNNQELQQTDEAKYLGIIFDNKLTWGKHTETTSRKAETD